MKIVFLDIDGVLCTRRAHIVAGDAACRMDVLDPSAAQMVGRLAEADPFVRFVISSDWREVYSREKISEKLAEAGFLGQLHDDWRTPSYSGGKRGDQIQAWLGAHPEVEAYICIDDKRKGYRTGQPLVHVATPEDGFLVRHFHKACALLFGSKDAWYEAKKALLERQEKTPPDSFEPGGVVSSPPLGGSSLA